MMIVDLQWPLIISRRLIYIISNYYNVVLIYVIMGSRSAVVVAIWRRLIVTTRIIVRHES